MSNPARISRSVRHAVTTVVLVAAGAGAAFAESPEAQTQEPPRPSASTASDADSRDRPRESHEPHVGNLSLFDHRLGRLGDGARSAPGAESWLSGFDMTCVGCVPGGLGARPTPTNALAPWALEGRWQRQTKFGAVSAGFAGVRNYALPLSTVVPLAGGVDPVALSAVGASQSLPVSQWSVTAGLERTLARRPSGASIGVAADVLIPVKHETNGIDDPRVEDLGRATARLGIVLRW